RVTVSFRQHRGKFPIALLVILENTAARQPNSQVQTRTDSRPHHEEQPRAKRQNRELQIYLLENLQKSR
ncbi:hypothetical protein J6590_066775, partial [Homalodisca vitripennis]